MRNKVYKYLLLIFITQSIRESLCNNFWLTSLQSSSSRRSFWERFFTFWKKKNNSVIRNVDFLRKIWKNFNWIHQLQLTWSGTSTLVLRSKVLLILRRNRVVNIIFISYLKGLVHVYFCIVLTHWASIYLLNINNRKIRKRFELC